MFLVKVNMKRHRILFRFKLLDWVKKLDANACHNSEIKIGKLVLNLMSWFKFFFEVIILFNIINEFEPRVNGVGNFLN